MHDNMNDEHLFSAIWVHFVPATSRSVSTRLPHLAVPLNYYHPFPPAHLIQKYRIAIGLELHLTPRGP